MFRDFAHRRRIGISRAVAAVVVIVVIVVAAVGIVLLTQSGAPASSSSATSSSTGQTASSSSSSSSQTSSTGGSSTTSSGQSTSGTSQTTSSSSTTATTSSTSSSSTTRTTSAPQTLTIDDFQYPAPDLSQLWAAVEGPYPGWLDYTVYQPLVTTNYTAQYTTGTLQYVPVLAANWTVSSDGKTYTFNLRNNVMFSDGNPFNAYQVWAWMYGGGYYLSGNSSNWLQSYNLFDMSNVNFGPSTISMLTKSGLTNPTSQVVALMTNSSWPIYVTGPHQVVFHLKTSFQWFLGTLVGYLGLFPDVQFILDHGGFGTSATPNPNFGTNPIPGTGPYQVTQVSVNSYVKFTQNPNYWGSNLTQAQILANPYVDPGHVKNVIINYKPDDVSRYTDLSTGAAQVAVIQSSNWNLVLANPDKYAYVTEPSYAGLVYSLNIVTQNYPTNITAVRQAIVHAINYSDITKKVFFGQLSPWVGPEYPLWKDFYDLGNLPTYSYNLTLAKQDLAKANITSMPPLVFKVAAGCSFCENTAEIVQADLAQIGITVNIEVVSFSQLVSYSGSYTFNLQHAEAYGNMGITGFLDFAPATLSPADYWLTFVSNASLVGNHAIYYNPIVQKCVNSFTTLSNITEIQSLCRTAQQQIYNDAPYAWVGVMKLWDGGGSIVYNKNVIKSVGVDPLWDSQSTVALFNMVTFNG